MLRTISIGFLFLVPAVFVYVVAINLIEPSPTITVASFYAMCAAGALFGVWLDNRLNSRGGLRGRRR